MRVLCSLLAFVGMLCAQARPSYLHNRHSTNLVWQTRATTFTGVDTTKTGTVIHWDFGDGTSQDINDPVKVYPDTSLKTVYMVAADGWGGLTLLDMNSRSLRGPIPSLARATALVTFYVHINQLTGAIPSLTTNTALVYFHVGDNQVTGSIPSLTTNTALVNFYVYDNQLTGTIPSLAANTALVYFYVYNNQLTGSIPSLTANTALAHFSVGANQLTGSIPSLAANTALVTFLVHNNQLTGSIPSLAANTALVNFWVYNNQLTGSIPSLIANTALANFQAQTNQLTGYAGGLGTRVLTIFNASVNALTEVAVNAILADLVVAQAGGNPVCTVSLSGGTNAAPTGQGLLDKATLIAAKWTVTTN